MSASDKNSSLGRAKRGAAWVALFPRLQEIVGAGGIHEQAWRHGLYPGAVIDRFELLREIGRGRSGVIWEARDRELGKSVAFKAVAPDSRPELSTDRLFWLSEAEAAARVSHPNIVGLFDAGSSEQGSYLIRELLHGETLGERLETGPLPLKEALEIAVEVAKGLAHVHAQGILHRDLRPEKIFLCDDGRVMLLEFACSHALVRPRSHGSAAPYTAPEQWQGNPEDPRTDVFALGVILFEMLSGDLPFPDEGSRTAQGDRPAARLKLTQEKPPSLLASLRRAVRAASSFETGRRASEELGDLVARMLEKDPVNRPQGMAEILSALARLKKEAPRSVSVAVHASTSGSQPDECGAFETTLEEVAFRGQEPTGDLLEHLASCTRCADRLKRERDIYRTPPELKGRVFKALMQEAGFVPSLDAKASRPRRMLQAVLDAFSPAPGGWPVEELQSRIRKASAAGGPEAAATEAIRALGPRILGDLRTVSRSGAEVERAFSQWAEKLWLGLLTYRGPLPIEAWALQLAWKEAVKLRAVAGPSSRPLGTSEAAWSGRRRWLVASIGAVALVVVLVPTSWVLLSHRTSRESHEMERILGTGVVRAGREPARIPVVVVVSSNDTGDPELDNLSELFITALRQSQLLAPLAREQMLDILARQGRRDVKRIDKPLGRDIARQVQAKALLLVSIRRFDRRYVIDVMGMDPLRDEHLFALREEGIGKTSLQSMIGRLSDRIRQSLKNRESSTPGFAGPGAKD